MSDLLKEYVEMILLEKAAPVVSYKQVGDQLTNSLKSLNVDVSHVNCKGPESKEGEHCRIFLNDLADKSDADLMKLARNCVKKAFGGSPRVKNIGQVHSGRFDTYEVTDASAGYSYNIVFSGGLTSGQRGGGYAYEQDVKGLLSSVNVESYVGTDTTKSDVFVMTASGKKVGIEVKGAGAKFGQPTLHYSYDDGSFMVPGASRSNENARLVVDILNSSEDPELVGWLNKIKMAWNKIHPENKMKKLETQIQPEDWDLMMTQSRIMQSGPKVPLDVSQIVKYYKKKEANYIQIQGKGLYSFSNVLELPEAISFVSAAKGLDAFIKPEILKSGGNKVLRASISLNYSTLKDSNLDLADPVSAKKFSIALKKH